MARGKAFDQATDIKRDIKKKWLEEHLQEVEKLAGEWLGQLSLGTPFYPPRHEEDWKEAYQPPVERDGEKNHMLRRHVRSRTLWTHHADWLRLLVRFAALRKEALQEAKRLGEGKGEYWVLTALWQAFERAKNPPKSEDQERDWQLRIKPYYRPDSLPSAVVMFGGFAIGERGEVEEVREPHLEMIRGLARLDCYREAQEILSDIEDLGRKMSELGGRILKSHDILYSCRYCRHLWK